MMERGINPKLDVHPADTTKKFRWTVVFGLLAGGIINYLDRTNLSIATPEIMKDLDFTKTQIGLLGNFLDMIPGIVPGLCLLVLP
ncbi:hypothetical protein QRE66_23600 [Bacillus cereus]|nr:hypothetical protein QRE66_23600 [Bacillus cereus]